jgi:hypothetical protein
MGGFLLGLLLLLQLSAVMPALHALWHDDGGCEVADCAVATVASGAVDAAPEPLLILIPLAVIEDSVSVPATVHVAFGDCPPLPGRAPPV